MPLVAISADPAEDSRALAQKLSIPFPLLSDPGVRVADAYGVAAQGNEIAIPSTVILLPDRRIFWKTMGETAADRPAVQRVLAQLDRALAQH